MKLPAHDSSNDQTTIKTVRNTTRATNAETEWNAINFLLNMFNNNAVLNDRHVTMNDTNSARNTTSSEMNNTNSEMNTNSAIDNTNSEKEVTAVPTTTDQVVFSYF